MCTDEAVIQLNCDIFMYYNCTVSDGFIIEISVLGIVMVIACFLNMIIAGGIKIKSCYFDTAN